MISSLLGELDRRLRARCVRDDSDDERVVLGSLGQGPSYDDTVVY